MNNLESREHLEYPELTMYQMVRNAANASRKATAMDFYGTKISYGGFLERIDRAARAFVANGVGFGDAVTICMPNVPQAMVCFYALNKIGAIANMVHPQSAHKEITFYLNISQSKMILVPDLFYENVEVAVSEADHPVTVLVARMQEEFNPLMKAGYLLKAGKDYLKYPNTDHALLWTDFLKSGSRGTEVQEATFDASRTAVILYSGGTTGEPKGICLSDLNMNACAIQAKESIHVPLEPGYTMLSCMPCFHGFGLGMNLHTVLIHGATCILMPTFNIKSYSKMIIKKKPNFVAGVPTIFEALLHIPSMENVKLDFLKGMFSGGDSLSIELKKKIDTFLEEHGASIQVREGYGLTECVTASCLTPKDTFKPGSIGVPFPDTIYCIVKPGTDEVMEPGQEGEIILTGPSVMLGYLKNPEATAETLKTLPDGRKWLYSGDLGYMDEEGYVYFKQRIKRLIVTNGYNVYPGQLENLIDKCPEVAYCCVIGVKDPKRMHRVKAYVVLKDGYTGDDACRERIMAELRHHVAAYALPREIEFRNELPKTLVGKVAYRVLEEEAEKDA